MSSHTTTLSLPARPAVQRRPPDPGVPAAYEIVQLLALAHTIERATEDGTATRTQVARALGLTKARLTQICKLAFLAPDIQAEVIERAPHSRLTERALRRVVTELDWGQQRLAWSKIRERTRTPTLPSTRIRRA